MSATTTTSATFFHRTDGRLRLGWFILLFYVAFFAVLFGASTLFTAPLTAAAVPKEIIQAAGAIGVTAASLLAVWLLRRFVDRQPWSGIGITVRPAKVAGHLLAGMAIATVTVGAVVAVVVGLGHATWTLSVAQLPVVAFVLVVQGYFLQGFPEELWFRGYLFRNLADRLSPWVVFALSAVMFGALHILSRGGAANFTEQVFYMVAAVGMGAALTACRMLTGSIWLGVGFHAAYDTALGTFATPVSGRYIPMLLILFVFLLVVSAILLAVRQLRKPPFEGTQHDQ